MSGYNILVGHDLTPLIFVLYMYNTCVVLLGHFGLPFSLMVRHLVLLFLWPTKGTSCMVQLKMIWLSEQAKLNCHVNQTVIARATPNKARSQPYVVTDVL